MNLTQFENVASFLGNCINYLITQLNNITIAGYSLYYIILGLTFAIITMVIIRKLV